VLFHFEKLLTKKADYLVSATEGMREYALRKYGVTVKNFFVKPACVDLTKFNATKRKNVSLLQKTGLAGKIVCVYAGKFGGIYLTDEVFRFFHFAELKWGEKFRALILTPHDISELSRLASSNGFDPKKMVVHFVPHEQMADYMGMGDFAITPVKPIPTKRYCTPIKDGEYWALGLPVVITKDISDDSDIIRKNNAGVIIEELNDESYRRAVDEMEELLRDSGEQLTERITALAIKYRSFDIATKIYGIIYGDDERA
jgi:hypothetical protein